MKAILKKENRLGLWMEDVPFPTLHKGEVLIRVKKTSICGTDLHIYKWDSWAQKTIRTPMIIGHEFMGEIVDIAKDVQGLKVGDRVSGEGHIVCNVCTNCRLGRKHLCSHTQGIGVNRSGCFAEYFSLPAENIFLLPSTVTDEEAAIFDPFGNAVHTALTFNITGKDVLITGAGPIGIMAAAVAKQAGAHSIVITDVNDYRLELAKKMGATHAINIHRTSIASVLKELNMAGFQVGLEMSGHPDGLRSLLKNTQHGGEIAILGIFSEETSIDWDLVIFKMLTLKGIYGREIFGTWFQMVNLIENGLSLQPVITHHFPATDFQKGIDSMLSGQAAKVILNWT